MDKLTLIKYNALKKKVDDNYSYQDFWDDTRLAKGFEKEDENASGDDDESQLQDEEREGVV